MLTGPDQLVVVEVATVLDLALMQSTPANHATIPTDITFFQQKNIFFRQKSENYNININTNYRQKC